MRLDLRYPIGTLLAIYGVLLALQGVRVPVSVVGLNVNLYWGAAMAGCGAAVLYLARRKR